MTKPPRTQSKPASAEAYLMRIADLLSDDPLLVDVLGTSFKVVADYDRKAKRVTYSFRRSDSSHPDEDDAKSV